MQYKDCKIGQRVLVIKNYDGYKIEEECGTIMYVNSSNDMAGIEFDNNINGHNGRRDFECKDGHGLFVPVEYLKLEDTETVTIIDAIKQLHYSKWKWEDVKTECKTRGINVVGKKKEAVYALMEEWDELALTGTLPIPTQVESPSIIKSEDNEMLEQLKCFLIKFKQEEKLVNEIKEIINS